jgi:hypothetical protein
LLVSLKWKKPIGVNSKTCLTLVGAGGASSAAVEVIKDFDSVSDNDVNDDDGVSFGVTD